MNKFKDISAIILSGGRSSRMGTDKALLNINGKTALKILIDKLSSVFDQILISSDIHDDYAAKNLRVVEDIYKEHGPLGGLHSGLIASKTIMNFVLPCDIPLLKVETIKEFVNTRIDGITVTKFNNQLNPFPGIYPKTAVDTIEYILKAKENLSMYNFLNIFGCKVFDLSQIMTFSDEEMLNMNNREDYEKVKQILRD